MSEESNVFIGDFEIALDQVQIVKLPVRENITFRVKKSERKTYEDKETGAEKPYYSLQLELPDFPGETIFHTFFLSAKNLQNRHADRSWKLFLDVLNLPYTTQAANNGLVGVKFVGTLREDAKSGDYVIASVVGPAA